MGQVATLIIQTNEQQNKILFNGHNIHSHNVKMFKTNKIVVSESHLYHYDANHQESNL
jgi:hypothetical protein